MFSKHDAIAGTFIVDPALPSPMGKTTRRESKRQHKLDASIKTRHGRINLDLAVSSKVAGQATPFVEDKNQTPVYVSTHHVRTSPPATPPASRFTLRLPPSCPPTPPSAISRGPTVAADARTLYNLLNQLPKPSLSKEQTRLAREVVDEAFDGLSAFIALLESIQVHMLPVRSSSSTHHGRVSVNVHEVHPSRLLDLHVESCHEWINLLLPPTFDGPLIVQALPRKTTIGISGQDKLKEPLEGPTLLEKVGRFFETQGRAFGQYMETQARMIEQTAQA
ncbi:hypothetical protein BD311DRAFT_865833 [Dichomitus squalens]|uniref:Uncharacterized protein n=1 Tax=Dichomitus squalens TaxID=114155 RepID=A0A4Q9MND5_9APHY|nr:hypothetical protein BD311DRAFT_865833 [Dichomitus squalens]